MVFLFSYPIRNEFDKTDTILFCIFHLTYRIKIRVNFLFINITNNSMKMFHPNHFLPVENPRRGHIIMKLFAPFSLIFH